jgi:hypothetical protein
MAKPSGGSVSPLEKYAQWFFDLIAVQPDLTLDEVMVAKKAARIPGSRSAVGSHSPASLSSRKELAGCASGATGARSLNTS